MSNLLVPQKISHLAFYSIPIILLNSAVAHKYKYYKMSACLTMLSVTTGLHWNRLKPDGIIRIIDIIVATCTLSYGTYITFSFSPLYRTLCTTSMILTTSAFCGNGHLFYHQTQKTPKMLVLTDGKEVPEYETNYWYFSLLPTKPGSIEREKAYYRNTYTHMVFMHFLPAIMLSIGMIANN